MSPFSLHAASLLLFTPASHWAMDLCSHNDSRGMSMSVGLGVLLNLSAPRTLRPSSVSGPGYEYHLKALAWVAFWRQATLPCRRQIVEYVYFAFAMAVCLFLALSALTNCPFLAGFFTLVLLVLTLIYSIVAAVLFITASIGNDA